MQRKSTGEARWFSRLGLRRPPTLCVEPCTSHPRGEDAIGRASDQIQNRAAGCWRPPYLWQSGAGFIVRTRLGPYGTSIPSHHRPRSRACVARARRIPHAAVKFEINRPEARGTRQRRFSAMGMALIATAWRRAGKTIRLPPVRSGRCPRNIFLTVEVDPMVPKDLLGMYRLPS